MSDLNNTTQPSVKNDPAVVKFEGSETLAAWKEFTDRLSGVDGLIKPPGEFERLIRSKIIGPTGTEQELMLALAIGLDNAHALIGVMVAADRQFVTRVDSIIRANSRNRSGWWK